MNRLSEGPGHTFVINGVLEALGWDSAIIPTDAIFDVTDIWRTAAGLSKVEPWDGLRPDGWTMGSTMRAKVPPGQKAWPTVWFLDVPSRRTDELGHAAADCIRAMVNEDGEGLLERAKDAKRAKPLIALPVIGVGGGGHGRERGAVIRGLLEGASVAAAETGVDVVIVARSRADYAALQHLRSMRVGEHAAGMPLHEDLLREAKDLGEKASKGELALFVGAGVSMSAGLPSWNSLITTLAESPDLQAGLEGMNLSKHGPLEKATLLDAVSQDSGEPLGKRIAALIGGTKTPGLSHALLAGLRCREVVTTNYDRLYETAVDGIQPTDKVAVAPWDRVSADRPWILKMHGDVDHASSIVLTRRSFVSYDKFWKPVGSIVQSLMMTRHLLVLGASMTDDNLVRLAHEVAELRLELEKNAAPPADQVPTGMGTIVTLFEDAALRKLWEGRFRTISATGESEASEARGSGEREQLAARKLSIFLDAIGMYALSDASYLLDRSYEPTSSTGREVAGRLQALGPQLASLAERDPHGDWAKLAAALTAFGLEIRGEDRHPGRAVSASPSPRASP